MKYTSYLVQAYVQGPMDDEPIACLMSRDELLEFLRQDDEAGFLRQVTIYDVRTPGEVKKIERSEI